MDRRDIVGMVIEASLATARQVRGCKEEEVVSLEAKLGRPLPKVYREFLLAVGHGAGKFLVGTDASYGYLPLLWEWAEGLLRESGADFTLKEDHFVFLMHQGYWFLFFSLSEGDDPPVYKFYETDARPNLRWSTFSDYLRSAISGDGF